MIEQLELVSASTLCRPSRNFFFATGLRQSQVACKTSSHRVRPEHDLLQSLQRQTLRSTTQTTRLQVSLRRAVRSAHSRFGHSLGLLPMWIHPDHTRRSCNSASTLCQARCSSPVVSRNTFARWARSATSRRWTARKWARPRTSSSDTEVRRSVVEERRLQDVDWWLFRCVGTVCDRAVESIRDSDLRARGVDAVVWALARSWSDPGKRRWCGECAMMRVIGCRNRSRKRCRSFVELTMIRGMNIERSSLKISWWCSPTFSFHPVIMHRKPTGAYEPVCDRVDRFSSPKQMFVM